MWLGANPGYLLRNPYVSAIAIRPSECVTRKRSRWPLSPGHDDATVNAAGQRHANGLLGMHVSRQDSDEGLLKVIVKLWFAQKRLLLPRLFTKVKPLPDGQTGRKAPLGRSGQQENSGEDSPILQSATAGNHFSQACGV